MMSDEEKLKQILRSNEKNKIYGQYDKDEAKANEYAKAVQIVDDLCQKTGLFAYRADDVNMPLYVHAIEIQWLKPEVELEAKLFAPLFEHMEHLNMSKIMTTAEVDFWLFTTEIYTEVE